MPANFPEIWLNRVIQNLDNTDGAPFLEGLSELAVDVSQINGGTSSEKNVIHIPTTEFEVDVLINNNTYPLEVQTYSDDTIQLTLDKYQTKVVTLTDDQIIGASYEKIDVVTKALRRALLVKKYKKAIHSIAPLKNTENTPVLEASGSPNATGRPTLTYEDLVRLKDACDTAKFPMDDRRLVLHTGHWNDLLLDRKNFGNQLVDYAKGKPAPVIADFELQKYQAMPIYTDKGNKRAFGSVATDTDKVGSVVFCKSGIAKKTGLTKQYFVPSAQNPSHQTNDLSYRHYFVVVPFQNRNIGAII